MIDRLIWGLLRPGRLIHIHLFIINILALDLDLDLVEIQVVEFGEFCAQRTQVRQS